jgi:hemoglobin
MAMTTLYDELGGETGVRSLVDRFYDEMDKNAAAAPIRAMHATNLSSSRDKLFWFLSGWLGGPQLFVEKRGHPRLRARHLPFAIDQHASDQWMMCMRKAMLTATLSDDSRNRLDAALLQLANHMQNSTPRGLKLVE